LHSWMRRIDLDRRLYFKILVSIGAFFNTEGHRGLTEVHGGISECRTVGAGLANNCVHTIDSVQNPPYLTRKEILSMRSYLYMGEIRSNEDILGKLAAGRLFRRVSIAQIIIHLFVYIASFIKLIIIEAGGYYDTKILLFIGMTAISMPLFGISGWLVRHSLKISPPKRFWGYCFHLAVLGWSISIAAVSYLM
jgi:hypothetical protein